jgi:hypothetical protein
MAPFSAGLAALPLVWLAPRLAAALGGLSFERVGLLWAFGEWKRADPGTYLVLLGLGGIMAVGWGWAVFTVRNDRKALVFTALSALAVAGLWRTVVFPPSGDEPAILLAAWHWLATGSLDITGAFGTPAETASRAVEFRDELIKFHTVGPPGGARYTYHGFGIPVLYGILLMPAGRIGLALALTALSWLAFRLTTRTVVELGGREPGTVFQAALLLGSPVAVYTVFFGSDLAGCAIFALGCLGLARRRTWMVAAAAAGLSLLHHKFVFVSAGLVLGAFTLAPWMGIVAGLAWAAVLVPEVLVMSHYAGFPLWPPSALSAWQAEQMRAVFAPAYAVRSIPGLLADRHSGLVYYPAFLAGLAGCAWWWRHEKRARAIVLAALPYILVLLCYNTWEGGLGAPSRLLVVVFPAVALGLAALDRRFRSGTAATLLQVAVWAGIGQVLLMVYVPPLAFQTAKLKVESLLVRTAGFDPLAALPAVSDVLSPNLPVLPIAVSMVVLAVVWAFIYKALRARS